MTAVTITITYDQRTGQVNVSGPLDQKLLCYGILEVAKDTIRAFVPKTIHVGAAVPSEFLQKLKTGG